MCCLYFRSGPDNNPAPSGFVSVMDTLFTIYYTSGGEIGSLDMLHQLFCGDLPVIYIGICCINYLSQIVRCHICCHTYCDTGSSVNEQIWNPGGHYGRLLKRIIKVEIEINRILIYIG